MIFHRDFAYTPSSSESESASHSYVMSVMAIIAGMPLPIVNLLATLFFYIGKRKSTDFVRWHCTQALLVQVFLFFVNAVMVIWVLSILFGDAAFSNSFIAYLIVAALINLCELIMTIYSAVYVNRGRHLEWWLFGEWTHHLCKTEVHETETAS